ncbi:MAG: PKD domain-containing protein [Cytophagales bacterium]|nr:PKD domain-containing protein [Cytophagales bacterium]MDW8384270.1 PKD domain-containing protein [Flammeovirgaceae bacterium]
MRFFQFGKWLLLGAIVSVLMSGCQKDDDKKEQKTPPPAPVAKFMVVPSSPVVGQLVNFISTSENASTLEWDLGKGEPKLYGTTVSTTYSSTGNYTVTLKAIGPGGENIASQTITVGALSVASLKAMFQMFDPTGASVRAKLDTITFFNTTIAGNVGGLLPTYKWQVITSGGTVIDSSTSVNFTYAFANGGNYRVRLTATTASATDTTSMLVTVVAPPAPTSVLVRPTDTTIVRGNTLVITERSRTNISDFLNLNLVLKVLRGDSVIYTESKLKTNTSDVNFNFSVPVSTPRGTYRVRLVASNQFGIDSTEMNILVRPRPTVASFTFSPNPALYNNPVTFTNTSTGDSLSFIWNVNGNVYTTTNVTYNIPMLMTQFPVVLIANGDGGSDTLSVLMSASDPGAVIASFNVPATLEARNPIAFTNTSINATQYHWDFGVPTLTNDTANVANPSYTYDNPGTYTVKLIASDGVNYDTATLDIVVKSPYDLYVIDFTSNAADRRIVMIDLDKPNPDFNNISDADTMSVPSADITLAYANGNLYFVNTSTNKLMRRSASDFVGTTLQEVGYTFTTRPNAMRVDGDKLYWITPTAVHRMNLDGTGVELNFITSPNTGADFRDFYIDGNNIYVNDVINNVTLNGVYRANKTAGATMVQLFDRWLYGIAVAEGKIFYFPNETDMGVSGSDGAIVSRPLSNPSATPTIVANPLSPKGRVLFITPARGKLYLSNRSPQLLQVNISGTNQTQTPVLQNYNWGATNSGPRQSVVIQ